MIYLAIFSLLFSYVYEDSDSLIVQNDSLIICGDHQYNIKVHISNAGKLKVRQWSAAADSFGKLNINAPVIIIEDSSSIMGSELGYFGAYMNTHPWGYGPGGGGAGGVSGGAGGGGAYGGNGGAGGDIYPGFGGSAYGDPQDTLIDIGSGGGAGRLSALDGAGGDGGAQIFLRAQYMLLDSSYILTNGQRGHDGSIEAGGGGAGGGVMLWADSMVISYVAIIANGGNGGDGSYGGGGGAGGGRIKIFYTNSLDTTYLATSAQGGNPGTGAYGNPEPGSSGTIHIAQIIGIEEIASELEPRVFLQSHIIRYQTIVHVAEPPVVLHLYNATGCLVKSFRLEKTTECLKLGDLAQGVYFLKVGLKNNRVEKIILLK